MTYDWDEYEPKKKKKKDKRYKKGFKRRHGNVHKLD